MKTAYIGFRLCNLFIPGDPDTLTLATPSGTWSFNQTPQFAMNKAAITSTGQCGDTYTVESTITLGASRAASMDATFGELLPICLGASYLTGLAVAPVGSTLASEIHFATVGNHFPRQRSMGPGTFAVTNGSEFCSQLGAFVKNYPHMERAEKARLLVHHWLDALACWSLEDLVLSTATMLEIIAATAEDAAAAIGLPALHKFVPRINYAATRFGLDLISNDFRLMRNDLVHEGSLSGTRPASRFPNKTIHDCARATAKGLHWIDLYMHHALNLGPLCAVRFTPKSFVGLNSFSLN